MKNPQFTTKEIRRLGSHLRMVQVIALHGSVKPSGGQLLTVINLLS
jgi:hypothetical protein